MIPSVFKGITVIATLLALVIFGLWHFKGVVYDSKSSSGNNSLSFTIIQPTNEGLSISSYKEQSLNLAYSDLLKNLSVDRGKKVWYSGKVFGIENYGGNSFLSVDVSYQGGKWSNTMEVYYPSNPSYGDIVSGDRIKFWGVYGGLVEYKSIAIKNTKVPLVSAEYISVQ